MIDLWGFRLRRDGKFRCSLSGSHHPRLSENSLAVSVFIDAFEIRYLICLHFSTLFLRCQSKRLLKNRRRIEAKILAQCTNVFTSKTHLDKISSDTAFWIQSGNILFGARLLAPTWAKMPKEIGWRLMPLSPFVNDNGIIPRKAQIVDRFCANTGKTTGCHVASLLAMTVFSRSTGKNRDSTARTPTVESIPPDYTCIFRRIVVFFCGKSVTGAKS